MNEKEGRAPKSIFPTPILADAVAGISGSLLLACAADRARRIAITYDEALTYLAYVRRPVRFMYTYNGVSANNHVLNTLAMKAASALLGPSEVALRLPNLLGFAVFLVFSWLLLRRYAPPVLALGGFLATAANPLLLEYFSLARGYGLALGFVVPGLYFLARSVEEGRGAGRREVTAFVLLALGAVASFTTLVVFLAAGLGALVVRGSEIERAKGDPLRRGEAVRKLIRGAASFAAVSAALAATVGIVLIRIAHKRQLYYGGRESFWADTVGSLVEGSLSRARYAGAARPAVLALAVVAFALAAAGALAFVTRRESGRAERAAGLMALIAIFSVGISLSQHFLLGTLYLVNRTALFFIPLFGLAATLSAARFVAGLPRAGSLAVGALFALAGAACLAHLRETARPYRLTSVPFDREMLDDLDRIRARDHRGVVRLGVSWVFEPQINYYRATRGLGWLLPVHTKFSYSDVDDCFVAPKDQPEAARNGFVVVEKYAATGDAILVRGLGRPGISIRTGSAPHAGQRRAIPPAT